MVELQKTLVEKEKEIGFDDPNFQIAWSGVQVYVHKHKMPIPGYDKDDVMQSMFEQLWRKRHNIDVEKDDTECFSFGYTLAKNYYIDLHRRNEKKDFCELIDMHPYIFSDETGFSELVEEILSCLRKTNSSWYNLFKAFVENGFDYKRAAVQMGISSRMFNMHLGRIVWSYPIQEILSPYMERSFRLGR